MADLSISAPKQPIDRVSKAIIDQLQQHGRRSFSGIAEAVGISEAAVRQRVRRLLPGVHLAETLVYLKTVKQQYNWGTR
jgi:Lrp/AsnC family transcriptional regulator for asnA, asnC and gidA